VLVAYQYTLGIIEQEAVNPVYLLAWIPESLLNERGTEEWDKFVKVEGQAGEEVLDDGMFCFSHVSCEETYVCQDIVLIDLPRQRPESYAFSVPITSIYSLIVHPPTLSSWCTCCFQYLQSNSNHFYLRWLHRPQPNQRRHPPNPPLSRR